MQAGQSGFPYQGSSWQTQLREQAACASCVRQCWHWHQKCPQGRYRYWCPSVLPFSSASWWLKHWRSKVLAVFPVGPMPEAVCSWTTQLLSCTAAGESWYGPVNGTLASIIFFIIIRVINTISTKIIMMWAFYLIKQHWPWYTKTQWP